MEKLFILSFQLISHVDNGFIRNTENFLKSKLINEKREITNIFYTSFSAKT